MEKKDNFSANKLRVLLQKVIYFVTQWINIYFVTQCTFSATVIKNVTATHLSSEMLNWICRNIKTNPVCLRLILYHSLMMER